MRSHNKLALVPVALLILTLVLQSCGLGAEDVPFTVRITNDTSQTLLDHSYFGVYERTPGALDGGSVVELKPGHSFLEAEFVDEGVDPDKISSLSGKTLGCLPFQFLENPPKPLEVNVTEMVPCKHWPAHGNIPKDWPDPNYWGSTSQDHLLTRQAEIVDIDPPTWTPTQTLRAANATNLDVKVAQANASVVGSSGKGVVRGEGVQFR